MNAAPYLAVRVRRQAGATQQAQAFARRMFREGSATPP